MNFDPRPWHRAPKLLLIYCLLYVREMTPGEVLDSFRWELASRGTALIAPPTSGEGRGARGGGQFLMASDWIYQAYVMEPQKNPWTTGEKTDEHIHGPGGWCLLTPQEQTSGPFLVAVHFVMNYSSKYSVLLSFVSCLRELSKLVGALRLPSLPTSTS